MVAEVSLILCLVFVLNAQVICPGARVRSAEFFHNPVIFNIALARKITSFFSYDPQSKLSEREVKDTT
jgi:hypothetical protein